MLPEEEDDDEDDEVVDGAGVLDDEPDDSDEPEDVLDDESFVDVDSVFAAVESPDPEVDDADVPFPRESVR